MARIVKSPEVLRQEIAEIKRWLSRGELRKSAQVNLQKEVERLEKELKDREDERRKKNDSDA